MKPTSPACLKVRCAPCFFELSPSRLVANRCTCAALNHNKQLLLAMQIVRLSGSTHIASPLKVSPEADKEGIAVRR